MNNEPVAWRTHYPSGWEYKDGNPPFELKENSQLLYTHPAKTQSHTETTVKILNYLGYAQEPSKEEGADARRDKLVEIISQSHPSKDLTDEEIEEIFNNTTALSLKERIVDFARAILRKSQNG